LLPTREPFRKGRRKIFSPDLSMQTPCASFNYLVNSFERFSCSCPVSVTIFILFLFFLSSLSYNLHFVYLAYRGRLSSCKSTEIIHNSKTGKMISSCCSVVTVLFTFNLSEFLHKFPLFFFPRPTLKKRCQNPWDCLSVQHESNLE